MLRGLASRVLPVQRDFVSERGAGQMTQAARSFLHRAPSLAEGYPARTHAPTQRYGISAARLPMSCLECH